MVHDVADTSRRTQSGLVHIAHDRGDDDEHGEQGEHRGQETERAAAIERRQRDGATLDAGAHPRGSW